METAGIEGHARIVLFCRADNAAIICIARKLKGIATRTEDEIQFVYELPLNAALPGPAGKVGFKL